MCVAPASMMTSWCDGKLLSCEHVARHRPEDVVHYAVTRANDMLFVQFQLLSGIHSFVIIMLYTVMITTANAATADL